VAAGGLAGSGSLGSAKPIATVTAGEAVAGGTAGEAVATVTGGPGGRPGR
jgi:hypothetical protein